MLCQSCRKFRLSDEDAPNILTSMRVENSEDTLPYHVPSPVLFETYKCSHNFSCLQTGIGNGPGNCEVLQAYGYGILHLKSREPDSLCLYRVSSSIVGEVCTCPTYNALYRMRNPESVEHLNDE